MSQRIITNTVEVPVKLNADGSNINAVLKSIQQQLEKMQSIQVKDGSPHRKQLIQDLKEIERVMRTINQESKMDSGLSSRAFKNRLAVNQKSVHSINKAIDNSQKNIEAFQSSFAGQFKKMEQPLKGAETMFDRFGRSLTNSLRYNLVNAFVKQVASAAGDITQHLSEVDDALTNIRIVSGKTTESLSGTLKEARLYAKELNTTTGEYLDAAETYYQQGLSDDEVRDRSTATVMAAQISGQTVEQTSQQITAALNGFNIAGSEINSTLDKMAALGAGTATSFQEISKAAQKVASTASAANVPLDDTLAMVATISSVTREAPESVGTSLNTILTRFNQLSAEDVGDASSYTSKIEKALQETRSGLTIFDEDHLLKGRMEILTDLAEKWKDLDENQQATIATAIAGTRQYNRLAALLENWEDFEEYREMSIDSEGALERQSEIYGMSLEAVRNQTQASKEELIGSIFDPETLKSLNKVLQATLGIVTNISEAVKGFGGFGGMFLPALASSVTKNVVPHFAQKYRDLKPSDIDAEYEEAKERTRLYQEATGDKDMEFLSYTQVAKTFSEEEAKRYTKQINFLSEIVALQEQKNNLEKLYSAEKIKSKDNAKEEIVVMSEGLDTLKTTLSTYEQLIEGHRRQRSQLLEDRAKSLGDGDESDAIAVFKKDKRFGAELAEILTGSSEGVTEEDIAESFESVESLKLQEKRFEREVQDYKELSKMAADEIKKIDRELAKDIQSARRTELVKEKAGLEGITKEADNQIKEIKIKTTEARKELEALQDRMMAEAKNLSKKGSPLKYVFGGAFDKLEEELGGPKAAEKTEEAITNMYHSMLLLYERGSEAFIEEIRKINIEIGDEIVSGETLFGGSDAQKEAIIKQYFKGEALDSEDADYLADQYHRALTNAVVRDSKEKDRLEGALRKDLDKTQATEEALKKRAADYQSAMTAENAVQGIIAGAEALRTYKIVTDETSDSQQKLTATTSTAINTVNVLLGVFGRTNPKLMALRTILRGVNMVLPGLIGNLNIFKDEFSKLGEEVEKIGQSFAASTEHIKEQANAVESAEKLYRDFAQMREEYGEVAYDQLDENERARYDQLSAYVETYAPELIRYYDAEGKAVVDLSQKYKDLEKNQKGYLRESFERESQQLYANLYEGTKNSANVLAEYYGEATTNTIRYKRQIEDISQDSTLDAEDKAKKLKTLNENLAETRKAIADVSRDWNNMVTTATLGSSDGYYDLDREIQDGLSQATDFRFFQQSESGLTGEGFVDRTRAIADAIIEASDEVRDNLVQNGADVTAVMIDVTRAMGITEEGSIQDLMGMDRASVVDGTFLDRIFELTPDKAGQAQEELDRLSGQLDELREKQKDLEQSGSAYYDPGASLESEEYHKTLHEIAEVKRAYQDQHEMIGELTRQQEHQQKSAQRRMRENMADMANSSVENYRWMAQEFNSMLDDIKTAELAGIDNEQIQRQKEQAADLYEALMGSDEAYYQNWKEVNAEALEVISMRYGIYADDYNTLNEFRAESDAAHAKYKMMVEMATAGNLTELDQEVHKHKLQNMISHLLKSEQTAEAAALIAMSEADQKTYIDNNEKLIKLKNLDKELEAKGVAADDSVKISASEHEMLQEHSSKFSNFLRKIASFFGVEGKFGGSVGEETYKKTRETTRREIQKKIGEIEKEQETLVDKMGGTQALEMANDHLSYISELEQDLNKLEAYQPDFSKLPSLDLPDLPKVKPKNNSGSVPPRGKGKGGSKKSPKSKSKKEKDVADLVFDTDPLKPYNDALKEIAHQTEILRKEREKLYGVDYINNLNAEASLNRESLRIEELKLKKAKEIGRQKRKALGSGVRFDEDGLITNYNEVLKSKERYANSLKGDAKEKAKKDAEDFKKLMDEYEKYNIEAVREVEKSVQNLKFNLASLTREKIEYPIELIVEANERDRSLVDFSADVVRFNKGKIHFSVSSDQNAQNLMDGLDTIDEIIKQTGGQKGFLDQVFGDPDLKGDTKQQLEMIKEQQDRMQKLGSDLMEFANAFQEAFGEGLQEAADIFSRELEKYNNIVAQYEYSLELAHALNRDSTSEVVEIYDSIKDIYNTNLSQTREMTSIMKESRDSFKKGTDEWHTANEQYMNMQAQVLEQERALAELLSDQYDDVVSAERRDLEKLLFGGQTAEDAKRHMEELREDRHKYLDVEEKIYELSKMERDIQKDISDLEMSPRDQQKLQKFLDAELKHLKDKEKISENDLELSRKQYEVIKARIDLERAREGEKLQLELHRLDDGSFGYMYVRNTEAAEEAQQKYEDAIDELYKYSIKRTEELENESLEIREKALLEYDRITEQLKSGAISEAEAVEQLEHAFDRMNDKLKENAREQAEMRRQVASAKLAQILGVSEKDLQGIDNIGDGLKTIFDTLEDGGELKDISDVLEYLGLESKDYIGSVGDQMYSLYEDLGGDSGAMAQIMEAFTETGHSTSAVIIGLLEETADIADLTEEILDTSLNGMGGRFDEFIHQISAGELDPEDIFTESIINGLDSVEVTWDNLAEIIEADLDRLVREFDISNPESALGEALGNVLESYAEYNKALDDSYESLKKNQKELDSVSKELNKSMSKTLDNLRKEIQEVTDLTKKYSKLRSEVTKAINEVTRYVNVLDKAKRDIENSKKPSTSGSKGSSKGSSSSSKGGSSAKRPGQGLSSGKRVRIVGNAVYQEAYGGRARRVAPDYLNSNRTDLYIDGSLNGRHRVKKRGGQYVGWFNPKSLQAFHTGGKVGIDKNEGLAVLEKNEAVITEKQADIIAQVRDSIEAINDREVSSISNVSNTSSGVTNIYADFPNATNRDEIQAALEGLAQGADQRIGE